MKGTTYVLQKEVAESNQRFIVSQSEAIDKLHKEIQDSKDAYQHAMNEADLAYRNISEREKELELLLPLKKVFRITT